jgi:hypothetical protein
MVESNDKSLVDRVISGSARLLATGLAVITPFVPFLSGCTPEKKAWADWPVAKAGRTKSRTYSRHGDDSFSASEDKRDRRIYGKLRFNGHHIESSYKLGIQTVLRLKKTCGGPGHADDCITKGLRHISPQDNLDGQTVLVTLRRAMLHYVLERDDTSFMDMEYDVEGGEDKIPTLRLTMYQVSGGKTINPLPKSGHGGYELKFKHSVSRGLWYDKVDWYDIIELDGFLRIHFDGHSIFTEDDIFEAKYFLNTEKTLSKLQGLTKNLYTVHKDDGRSPKSLLERASLLEDYARRYKRISERASGKEWEKRADVKVGLMESYNELMNEHMGGAWNNDSTKKLKRAEQSVQILRSLQAARTYLGIK